MNFPTRQVMNGKTKAMDLPVVRIEGSNCCLSLATSLGFGYFDLSVNLSVFCLCNIVA